MIEKTRNLLKPFGYKNIADFSPEEIEKLSHAVRFASPYLFNHLDYQKSPIVDFHTLSTIDSLFQHEFQNGIDISYIVSVADWSEHTLKSPIRTFDSLFKNASWYFRKEAKSFFNLKNSEIVLKNFIQYNEEISEKESRWKEQKKHEFLPPFCEKMIEAYCYYMFESKDNNKIEKSFELFLLSFNHVKTTYIKEKINPSEKSDKEYFARICLKFLSHAMIYSKNKINETNELASLLLQYIKPHFSYLWQSLSFIVKDNLFSNIKIGSESFNLSESLLFSLEKNEFENEIKKQFFYSEKIKNIDKIFYFMKPCWNALNIEEFSKILNKCLDSDHFEQTKPLLIDIGVREEHIVMVQKNKQNEEFYELVISAIKAKIHKEKLENMLSDKHVKEKTVKI